MGKIFRAILMVGTAMGVGGAGAGHAAEMAEQGASADDNSGVRDIIVTARRTSENLQTVPVAVTALDPKIGRAHV